MGDCVVKRVQVLLACYNGGPYLSRQLATLREQDDPCFSVLMQDDGSSDDTASLLREAAGEDERFHLAGENGRHLGAVGNFWSLLRQSDGELIALCDQDDEWASCRLSRCREAMAQAEARYGADTPLLVHSDCRLIDGDGALLAESFFRRQGWDPAAVALPRLLVQNNVTGCTLMMNAPLRRLALQYGDPSKMYMHDWFLALTAAAFGRIVFIPEPLVSYRQHGGNVMGASAAGQVRRGARALSQWEKGKARIALTYDHTRAFREACGDALPDAARRCIDGYLATQPMGKVRRVLAVRRGGYTMQSPITRAGQLLFG